MDPAVTANAQLLLGYIAGAVDYGRGERTYRVVEVDAAAGTIVLEHLQTLNTYRLSVVQLTGTE